LIEGRRVFGNVTKYIRMSASSNFGNMFSVPGGSLFLPFLPMAPIQLLLNNLQPALRFFPDCHRDRRGG
jgi:P-type Mg2+ transporter